MSCKVLLLRHLKILTRFLQNPPYIMMPHVERAAAAAAAAAAKSCQSCPTLCDPTDGSPPGSSVPGILQARTLEWVAISFSNAWKWKGKVKSPSHVRLLATPWTAAYQAPPSMGVARQEYWSVVPSPSPGKNWVFLNLECLWIFSLIKRILPMTLTN